MLNALWIWEMLQQNFYILFLSAQIKSHISFNLFFLKSYQNPIPLFFLTVFMKLFFSVGKKYFSWVGKITFIHTYLHICSQMFIWAHFYSWMREKTSQKPNSNNWKTFKRKQSTKLRKSSYFIKVIQNNETNYKRIN